MPMRAEARVSYPANECGMAERLSLVERVVEVGQLPLDPMQTLQEVLVRVRTGIGASTATVLFVDETGRVLAARAGVGAGDSDGVRLPVGAGVAGRVAATRQPVVVPDVRTLDPEQEPVPTAACGSVAAVPLTAAGALVGVLHVTSGPDRVLGDSCLSLLALVADRVALAVDRVAVAEREQRATAALRVSEHRARAVLGTAVDAIVTIDRDGRVESMNPAAERMFGYRAPSLVGRNISMLMPEPYRREHDGYLDRYERTGERRIIGIEREVVGQRRDGSTIPLELAVSEVGMDTGLFTGVLRDITERKRFEQQLAEQALRDPLTGLANRRLLREHLESALRRLDRHPAVLALLFLDLDRFKLVNDTLGHEAGDELLVHTAALLSSAVRDEDLVARFGGDEFVVLCTAVADQEAVRVLADRITATLRVPVQLRGREVFLSASIGVVTTTGGTSPSELLRDADVAMYQAKAQGRGRYTLLDEAAREGMSGRLQLSSDLQHALAREQLRPRYQPLVDLRTGEVVAVEALVRWEHPEHGLLSPAEFLGIAADIGSIGDLDAWMLRAACTETAEWKRLLGRTIGVWVNLSGQSLADPRLPSAVGRALTVSGLDASLLTLEITEGALMHDAVTTVGTLRTLRTLGVQLAVDDFGTGYSSLSYLQQFPVHALKIDRSFIGRLDDEGTDDAEGSQTITRAVVSLAAGLRMRTVAEGIETPGQLAAAVALGCDLGQGYFLGRPTCGDDILVAVSSGVVVTHS